ncbi:polymorphic toxin-type HINT domain-containing protein [Streptomyces lavendulocolor]|uniref:polymorphic toxin-type HINT domain-containing protein n=1 Tax=Streptomyces lavendulocolor TaxID=67316 RepID=UPI003C2D0066
MSAFVDFLCTAPAQSPSYLSFSLRGLLLAKAPQRKWGVSMSSSFSGRTFRFPGNLNWPTMAWSSRSSKKSGSAVRHRRAQRVRRLGAMLSVAVTVTLLPAEAWAIAPPSPRTAPTLTPLQQEAEAGPDEVTMEQLNSSWSGAPIEPPVEYNPTQTTPPTGGAAPVPLEGAGDQLVQAGTLPVRIGQASPTETEPTPPAPSGTWDVALEPRASTESMDVDGAVIKITPPETGSTPVDVELDYGQFEDLFGNEWSSRLKLTQLPECFLTTPELEECTTTVDVPSANDPSTDTVRATIDPAASQIQGLTTQTGGGPVVLAATDSASGAGGTYKATPLAATGNWTAGGSSGNFSWSYPLTVPQPPAGPAPKISLSYSSQTVDAHTSVTNGQASWIGDGWDYHPGYIERRYRPCYDDRSGTPNNDNSTDKKKSDLCWASDSVVMSLGGSATELVHDDASGDWVAQTDTGAKIEYLAKDGSAKTAQSDKYDAEYWVVTTRDGTKYWFGRNTLPGRTTPTNSALTVPVFGNHTGEPCHAATYASSSCQQAWRWNLDYVEDLHGNAMIIDWKKETNLYAKNEKFKQAVPYDRGGYPTQILYGLRSDNLSGAPAGKVLFTVDERCIREGTTSCSTTEFESKNYADKQPWWDTPSTLHCKTGAANCYITSPTFWSRLRLIEVKTLGQRTPGSTSLSYVDHWKLHQSFPKQRTDTHPPLWLESITRTGYSTTRNSSGSQLTKALPPVSFLPNDLDMPNRVAKSSTDQTPDFDRLRVETIRTETGGEIHVDYSDPCPVGGAHPAPASNTTRCFPVYWSADPEVLSDENLAKKPAPIEWFNKYVVLSVSEKDRVARQPDLITSYTYEDDAAWAKNTDEFTKPALRSYDQWRGYASVIEKKGATSQDPVAQDATEQSQTRTRYFRGMSGDAGRATITVKDSTGTLTLGNDLSAYQGRVAETLTYTKAGGSLVSRQLSWPYSKTSASRARTGLPPLEAYRTGTTRTDTIQHISGGRTRTVRELTTYEDTYGLATHRHTLTLTPNDAGGQTTGDQKCTTTAYVHNAGKHLIGLPQRERTTVGTCDQAGTATASQVISDTRTSYDALAAFGTAPVKGMPHQVDTVNKDGTGWITSQRTTYDTLGRVTKVLDTADNPTTTTYSPTAGPAFQITATNALGHTSTTAVDPARGSTLTITDTNGRKTTSEYDELGRLTATWSPSRPLTAEATARFEYQVDDNKVPAVRSRTLRDNGTYADSIAIYDGLLRPRQTQTEALGGGRIITDTLYNANGTARQVNNSYLAQGEPDTQLFFPKTVVANSTQTAYDGLNRPIRTTTLYEGVAQHSATNRYEGDWTLSRTAMSASGTTPLSGSVAAKTWTDALGRTSKVQHYQATDLTVSIDTTYLYEPRGHLAEVTDHKGNKWAYTYDTRGRKKSATDPDMGTAYFDYDNLDRQISTQDSQARTQHTKYDPLGRQTELREDNPATGPLVAKWTYDTLPGAKGHPVASIRYNDGAAFTSEVTGYDTEYRSTGSKTTIPATSMTTGLAGTYAYTNTYTLTGKLQAVDLPATPGGLAAEKLVTRYDGEGSATTTSGLLWYTAETVLSPYGEVLRTTAGEAPRRVWTTNTYDPHTGRIDQSIKDRETAPTSISALTYAYDTLGNITSITDKQPVGTEEQCFAYDPIGRLAHAWTDGNTSLLCPRTTSAQGAGPDRANVSAALEGSGYWHSYKFDAIGNRTEMTVHDRTDADLDDIHTYKYGKTVEGGPQPSPIVQPHTLTEVTSVLRAPGSVIKPRSTYQYDAAGNTQERVVDGNTQKLRWDRRNKLTSVDTNNDGTADVKYLYDASGNRLIEDDGTTRTLFLGEAEIVVNTAGQAVDARRYYSHPGAPTTVRTTGGKTTGHKITVLLSDHHNTATTAVEQTASQAVTRRRFDPYGNPRGTEPTTWPDRRTFLGSGIADPSTGLTHIGAREYDASTGRFVSADPIIDINDPLQMNGYSYANANPITHSDPTGLWISWLLKKAAAAQQQQQDIASLDSYVETVEMAAAGKPYVRTTQNGYGGAEGRRAQRKYGGEDAISETKWKMWLYGMPEEDIDNFGECLIFDCNQMITSDDVEALPLSSQSAAEMFGRAFADGKGYRAGLGSSTAKPSNLWQKCYGNSFPSGTKILMADGTSKAIEDIEAGEKVLSTDPETSKTVSADVTAEIDGTGVKDLVRLTLQVKQDDGVKSVQVVATAGHPFWVPELGRWVAADELQGGVQLQTDSGVEVLITDVENWTAARAEVHNLTVRDVHTYYVLAGETWILVHNVGGPCGPRKGAAGEARAVQELKDRGYTIMGQHVALESKRGTTSYVDIVATRNGSGLGAPEYFEVKNGPTATLSWQQKVVYGQLSETGGVILRSDKLSAWGLKSGDLLPQADVNVILYGGAKVW